MVERIKILVKDPAAKRQGPQTMAHLQRLWEGPAAPVDERLLWTATHQHSLSLGVMRKK